MQGERDSVGPRPREVSRDGFHCLLNGGRATTGIKKGRYAFEIRVLEAAGAQDAQAHQSPVRALAERSGGCRSAARA